MVHLVTKLVNTITIICGLIHLAEDYIVIDIFFNQIMYVLLGTEVKLTFGGSSVLCISGHH